MSLRVGVDLGATKIQTLLVADDNSIVARKRGATPATGGPSAVLAAVQETIEQLLVRAEQQGRLKPGLDHDSAYDMLAGAIYYRAWFGQKNKIGPEFLKLLVESVLLPRASAR